MGINSIDGFLRRHRRIALDSSPFIYHSESNPRYVALTDRVFYWLERPASSAVTSIITMSELLVHPYRLADEHRVDEFYSLLATYPRLDWVETGWSIADKTARIRAEHRLKTPDAIQAATAIRSGATGLITNDPAFKRVNDFETLVLEDLL